MTIALSYKPKCSSKCYDYKSHKPCKSEYVYKECSSYPSHDHHSYHSHNNHSYPYHDHHSYPSHKPCKYKTTCRTLCPKPPSCKKLCNTSNPPYYKQIHYHVHEYGNTYGHDHVSHEYRGHTHGPSYLHKYPTIPANYPVEYTKPHYYEPHVQSPYVVYESSPPKYHYHKPPSPSTYHGWPYYNYSY